MDENINNIDNTNIEIPEEYPFDAPPFDPDAILKNIGNNGVNMDAITSLFNQSADMKPMLQDLNKILEIQDGNIQRAYQKIDELEKYITLVHSKFTFIMITSLAAIVISVLAILTRGI